MRLGKLGGCGCVLFLLTATHPHPHRHPHTPRFFVSVALLILLSSIGEEFHIVLFVDLSSHQLQRDQIEPDGVPNHRSFISTFCLGMTSAEFFHCFQTTYSQLFDQRRIFMGRGENIRSNSMMRNTARFTPS